MSSRRTIVSCFISLSREISRMAVDGTPSSSASRRIFLSATIALVCVSLAASAGSSHVRRSGPCTVDDAVGALADLAVVSLGFDESLPARPTFSSFV